MNSAEIKIRSKSGVACYSLRRGLGLQALGEKEKIAIEFDCRKSDCGICIVRVEKGADKLSPPTEVEADFLRAMHADPDERLACQVRVMGDAELFVDDND
jgi:ferredoxin